MDDQPSGTGNANSDQPGLKELFLLEYRDVADSIRHYSTTRSALTSFLMTVGLTLLANYFSSSFPGNPRFFSIMGFIVLIAALFVCLVFSWRTERSAIHLKALWDWATAKRSDYPSRTRYKDLSAPEKGKIWAEVRGDWMNGALIIVIIAIASTFLFFACPFRQSRQSASTADSRELFGAIAHMDTTIFDAFNAHDNDKLMSMFTDDLEFYQDNDGLKNYQQCFGDFGKMFASTPDIRRDLVKDSLEVYPIKDYGAIEVGAHRFCHKEGGHEECGTFKFVMIWRKIGDSWKISRVISYGH